MQSAGRAADKEESAGQILALSLKELLTMEEEEAVVHSRELNEGEESTELRGHNRVRGLSHLM